MTIMIIMATHHDLTAGIARSRPSSGSMHRRVPSDVARAGSLVYWSSSREEDVDEAGLRLDGSGGSSHDGSEADSSQSSLSDSLFYSDDGTSQVTGIVSFATPSGDRDSSFNVGGDRYFEERSEGPGGDGCSLDGNVYIFTDEDSLSPHDHRLAAHESQMQIFRTGDSTPLNLPSLLEGAHDQDLHRVTTVEAPSDPHLPWSPISVGTPSGIVSPSVWQEYNHRRGKHVARRLLDAAGSLRSEDAEGPPPSSSPSRNPLWNRVARSLQSQTRKARQEGRRGHAQGAAVPAGTNLPPVPDSPRGPRRLSVVGSWDGEDGSVHCREDTDMDGLGGRTSSQDIVEMLDLGDDGHRLVQDLRRAFDSPQSDESLTGIGAPPLAGATAEAGAVPVPMWPVLDRTLWVPRYDLHVARSLRTPAFAAHEAY